jgi:hypothetical protein
MNSLQVVSDFHCSQFDIRVCANRAAEGDILTVAGFLFCYGSWRSRISSVVTKNIESIPGTAAEASSIHRYPGTRPYFERPAKADCSDAAKFESATSIMGDMPVGV